MTAIDQALADAVERRRAALAPISALRAGLLEHDGSEPDWAAAQRGIPLPLDEVQEVVEARTPKEANAYMVHGYRLLHLAPGARLFHPKRAAGAATPPPFVWKGVIYVLGRGAAVPAWHPPEEAR